MKKEKLCRLCGKTFKIKYPLQVFCSPACYWEYRRANPAKYPRKALTKRIASEKRKSLWKNKEWAENTKKKIRKAMSRADVAAKVRKANSRPRADRSFKAKKSQSDKLVGKRPENIKMFMTCGSVHTKHGYIDLGNGRAYHMRSTWERNVARYFEFIREKGEIQDWEYEPQRFFFENINFGNRTYLPDFRITEKDGYQYYVEVKGFMDKNSKTKLKRMAKYFPEIELQLIDKPRYKALTEQLSKIIRGWEKW